MTLAPKPQEVRRQPATKCPVEPTIPSPQQLARVRALARKYVPEGVSLADELIAERRREAPRDR